MTTSPWKSRTELLIGEEGIEKLANAHVLIAGLGGVGAWAIEHIVRAGIGEITIIDADVVTASNINRQLPALHSNIGQYKADIMKERLQDINPDLIIHVHKIFLKDEIESNIFATHFDYVLDCIDTLTPKINLIRACLDKKLPLISSLGSGAKMDHTAIRISDISKSYNCTLGRMLRKRLHKFNIYKGFKVVFSEELQKKEAVILESGQNKKSNTGTISYIPSIFGSMMAGEVIQDILEKQ